MDGNDVVAVAGDRLESHFAHPTEEPDHAAPTAERPAGLRLAGQLPLGVFGEEVGQGSVIPVRKGVIAALDDAHVLHG